MAPNQLVEVRTRLLKAYNQEGLWNITNPVWKLPRGITRGSEEHLIFLTLVYAISGGREPVKLWAAARLTFVEDAELFSPHFLAHAKPANLVNRLHQHGMTKKVTSEAVIWQKIGQALIMRADGSAISLLANHNFNAQEIMGMLAKSKATFPVLSGPQTAPRWLYGLFAVGEQPIKNAQELTVPLSPHAQRALTALNIKANKVSAISFDAIDALGRYGCRQKKPSQTVCPAANICPVAAFCQYS